MKSKFISKMEFEKAQSRMNSLLELVSIKGGFEKLTKDEDDENRKDRFKLFLLQFNLT